MTVTIVEVSKVGVKVGMGRRGVIEAVGVVEGIDVFVPVGIGDGVAVDSRVMDTGVNVTAGAQALSTKIPLHRVIKIGFNVFLLTFGVFQ